MIFTLEALPARHGDALLLHVGDRRSPALVLVDGGPRGVFLAELRKRLDQLRAARAGANGALDIDLVIVSHIDDDHTAGILDLTQQMIEDHNDGLPASYAIGGLWHNSFESLLGGRAAQVRVAASTSAGAAAVVAKGEAATYLIASVLQGQRLRSLAHRLALPVNEGRELIAFHDSPGDPIAGPGGVTLRVLGPAAREVDEVRKEWDGIVAAQRGAPVPAQVAAYLDGSVFGLASIVLLAEMPGVGRMLLTGDARGDRVITALGEAGLLDASGTFDVDVLKLPHHGSSRSVERDFFETIRARHYVVSGNGKHESPDRETFAMLLQARRDEAFHIHLTMPLAEIDERRKEEWTRNLGQGRRTRAWSMKKDSIASLLAEAERRGAPFTLHEPGPLGWARVELGEPLGDSGSFECSPV